MFRPAARPIKSIFCPPTSGQAQLVNLSPAAQARQRLTARVSGHVDSGQQADCFQPRQSVTMMARSLKRSWAEPNSSASIDGGASMVRSFGFFPRGGVIVWLLLAAALFPAPLPCAGADDPAPRRIKAASLDGGVGWINTAGPIDLKQLRGKFVIARFLDLLLHQLHAHSARAEEARARVSQRNRRHRRSLGQVRHRARLEEYRRSGARYEIEHPVVNDAEHAIWDAYGVQAGPARADRSRGLHRRRPQRRNRLRHARRVSQARPWPTTARRD